MMNKVLIYKLALLGFASSCLINVAQANIEFTRQPYEFRDLACGAEKRFSHYTIKNKGSNSVTITGAMLTQNGDDTFPDNQFLADPVLPSNDPYYCGYGVAGGFPFTLHKNQSCDFTIERNAEGMDCTPLEGDIPTGTVDRTFTLFLSSDQAQISTTVDYDITYLGSTDSFALVGNEICSGEEGFCGRPIETSALDGVIQLYQDVAITEEDGFLTNNIEYYNGSRAFKVGYQGNDIAQAAGADLYAAYHNLFNLTADSFHGCDVIIDNADLSGYTFDNSISDNETTVFCFDSKVQPPIIIDATDPVTFSGYGRTIIVINYPHHMPAFIIKNGADFEVDCGAPTSLDNVYWVVNGETHMHHNTRAAGSFVMNGLFQIIEPTGNQAQIVGRLLALNNDLDLQGNSIIDPNEYDNSCN